ncbi:hypothetical protein ACWFN4_29540 [Bacillus mycoides]|uniref:hypothetical protein n=1 Tax=Bacillus mycoides TaxID=1405 RepID=UPI001F245A3B|nr:hypothetical protein [Bacillus mycoides]
MDETEVGILFGVKRFDIQSVIENKDLPLQSKQFYGGYTVMVKESMGKSELFEKEKIKKRSDCFDRIERVIMVHQKLHEEKKCTYYHIEFVVKDERNKQAYNNDEVWHYIYFLY